MLKSMYSGISGMKANQTKLDVIGNNIANVNTTAFKSSSVRFSDTLYQTSNSATSPNSVVGGTNAKQTGLGTQVSSIMRLMSQGNAILTGSSLDVCIDGDGYFIVSTGGTTDGSSTIDITDNAIGTNNGTQFNSISYTRDGNFVLDSDGNLVTSSGYRIMGYGVDGTSYEDNTITNAVESESATFNSSLQPLKIPDEITVSGNSAPSAVESFEIGTDGVITVITSEGRYAIGQIAMATFKNPEGLTAIGGNRFQESGNSGSAYIMDSASVTTDSNSSAFGSLIQGYLEGSNVDITEQFTDMITATRAFQAASKMVSNGNEILQTITNLI